MLIKVKLTRSENLDYYGKDEIEIDIEEYLKGVVPAEIGNAALEASKAQAVVARTFALYRYKTNGSISDDSSKDQAFRVSRFSSAYSRAHQGVSETKGEVLYYNNKLVSNAHFSASNGGRTYSSEERWGGKRDYLIAREDPWDYAVTGGKKSGHGVGLSQAGAKYAASIGKGYREILDFYYPGTEIRINYGETKKQEEQSQKGESKPMAITNVEFVKFLKAMVGQPYWYGTCVYKCTNSLLASKAKQYPTHYTDTRMSKYKSHVANKMVAADCVGLGKGFVWTDGGKGVLESIGNDKTYTRKYGANGCPDKAADSMFAYAKSKGLKYGPIATIPEVPGLAVRKSGHVGYYIGNGLVVEAEGFSWGIVTTQLSKRPWTDWYEFPGITYVEGAIIPDDDNNNIVTPTPAPIESAVEPIAYAKVTTASGRLNLRKQPKAGSTILVRIPQNERIPVYEKLALWSKVSYGTVTGYVMNEFLTFEEKQETEEITATQATIRKGASGDAVKIMQEKLIALGYNLGSYGADGKFGSRTDAAIRAFQKANGLKVDGTCGPKTWEALVNAESKD